MLDAARVFLRRLLRRDRFEREVSDELAFHLDTRVDDLVRRGLDPDEARRRARVEFGGVEQYTERLRADRPGAWLDALVQDVRLSLRRLRQEPTFALAVVLTLSLGIGASTAVFGVVSTTLVSRIPFAEPDRLVVGWGTLNGTGVGFVSGPDYVDYGESNHSFGTLAAFSPVATPLTVTGRGDPWVVDADHVSWNLFRALRVTPLVGRDFEPEEEARTGERVAIISYGLWQRLFGGTPDVVGETIVLDGLPHTIIGVMPRGFRFGWDVDLWRAVAPSREARHLHNYHLLGRLTPGVAMTQAQRDVDDISQALERTYPDSNQGRGLTLTTLQEYLGGDVRAGLLLPVAATVCLLLIACANVAGLLLARGQRRVSEVAMRSALGASRWRLVRQLLTESVVLTLPAGALAIAVAYVLQELLLGLLPVATLGVTRPVVDGLVLVFALVTALATGLLVGIVPAVRGAAVSLLPHLGTGRQTGERAHSTRLRSSLVVAQIATSVVLLVGFGLVARSLSRLSAVDLGFSTERLLTARVELARPDYPERVRRQAFFSAVLAEIGTLPGVRSVGATSNVPILDPGNVFRTRSADRVLAAGEDGERTWVRRISSGYFTAMDIPLVRGRDISDRDRDFTPAVAVVNESLARRLYPNRDPVGSAVVLIDSRSMPPAEVFYEVVGVVRDARLVGPRQDGQPAMYLSIFQVGPLAARIVVRTTADPTGIVGAISEIVRREDPNALVAGVQTMDAIVDDAFADFRMTVRFLGLFAGVALLLAAVGLYGALAYHVSQQEHEIGVRVAMGATRAGVLGLVMRRGAWLVVTGLALGVAVAYPGTRLVDSLLYDTTPLDPATYAGAVLLLALVAATACLAPALRATRVDPAVVLRSE